MPFNTFKCHRCGHIWNSAKPLEWWRNYHCPRCGRRKQIHLHIPNCPDCNTPLKQILKSGVKREQQFVKRWECPNPDCPVIRINYTKNGVKVKRATVI